MRRRHRMAGIPEPRPWGRRVRALNPAAAVPRPEGVQIAKELPSLMSRLGALGVPMSRIDLSRESLTRLQRELREATESYPLVADDPTVQQFRKTLHLLLDH